jgi:hypothetical protein
MKRHTQKSRRAYLQSKWMLVLGLALLQPVVARAAEPGAVKPREIALREVVEVQEETIRLSHLLPSDAPIRLRQLAVAVELGRSPQPGSVRVLEASQIIDALHAWPELWHGFSIPDRVLIRRVGWTIQRTAVEAAILKFLGRSGAAKLLDAKWQESTITAREENPAVEVLGMRRALREKGYELRLRCVARAACNSFVVHLYANPDSFSVTHAQSSTPGATPWLAQSGKKAMLRLEGDAMSIVLPVICLERGELGENIRVLDISRHRVLHAQIVGPGVLQARF